MDDDKVQQVSSKEFSSSDFLDEGPSTMTIDADLGCLDRDQTIIAICTAGNRCGCAIYSDSTIHLVADRSDPGDPYKGLDIVIQRIDPDVVIVSAAQKKLITFLEKIFHFRIFDINKKEKHAEGVLDPAFTLAVVPNNWFSISHGEQKLIDSEWVKNQGITDPEQKSFFVFSRVKKSVDVCATRAISALDRYLTHEFTFDSGPGAQLVAATGFDITIGRQIKAMQSQISLVTMTTERTRVSENLMPILDVRYIDPGPVLSIDKFTLQTLGIFSPLNNKKGQQPQNEPAQDPDFQLIPSLYDVLNQCQSPQGRKTLHTMMMWPLQEIEELKHRHETIDFLSRPENRLFRDQLVAQLKNTVPLSRILTKLNQSVGTYKELSVIYKSLWSFVATIDIIKANDCSGVEIFNRILKLDSPGLRATIESIVSIVDFEASRREKRIQVQIGVDQNVDEKKEIVKNLMKFCDEVAIQETVKYKNVLDKPCRVLYIPRIGFLNSIDYSSTSELTQISVNKEFDILLHTEQSVYFKTKRMEELDNNAGDIACDLIDVQEDVVVNLQNEILKHSETILGLMELLGELDCLVAFASVSLQRGYTRPEFVPFDEGIEIREAYHPLHITRYNAVPNDIKFYKDSAERKVKIMVITGPNSCGKTTYMKVACLVVYMAHIGCFVPALHAKIPVVDAILTRMHSSNSISTGLSSFATELNQINYALGRATERSFIVIDEFGKGTRACDGFHLLKGLIAYFASRRQRSSHVMVATHFNRLIDHLQNYSEYILYKTFKVSRDPTQDNIVYEFKLTDGVNESSLADQVAARAGIPLAIIERANQIRGHISDGRPIQPRPPLAA